MSELHAALVAALSELTTVEAGRTADAGSYSYSYADLGDIVRLTRPVLASHGIVALTPLGAHGDRLAVSVHLIHTSGESLILGPYPFPAGRDAQATGSMVTYSRRYALLAALGMATGDDDDGHAATQAARQPEPTVESSVADEWVARMNEVADGRTRTALKNRFGKAFGQPHHVHPDKASEVDAFLDEHLALIATPADTNASEAVF